ncbi:hypothetical protein GA0115245_116712 [Streptomyces sp. di188]|nr:hypothetical protein GA0115238_125212 [Streptomyces sp. di50b]SCD92205.1 hypothetical protein GA0115245_116712 [Streptomyces sp. di188]
MSDQTVGPGDPILAELGEHFVAGARRRSGIEIGAEGVHRGVAMRCRTWVVARTCSGMVRIRMGLAAGAVVVRLTMRVRVGV